jgi:hypothetical protein
MKNLPKNTKVHTFGIGSEFDVELVNRLAKDGHGHCTEIKDLKKTSLPEATVKALGFALYPSLSEAMIAWDNGAGEMRPVELNELFYNQMVTSYEIVKKENFPNLKLMFTAINESGDEIESERETKEFKKVPADFGIFKLAAQEVIERMEDV